MNKKIVPWLAVGAVVIAILLLVYFFYVRPGLPPTARTTGAPPGPSAAGAPAVKPPAAVPAPQAAVQKPPAPPPIEEAVPAPGVTAPGSKVTLLPPLKAKKQFGVLVGKYHKYHSAGRMLARLKKHGIPGFIKRKEPKRGPYEVWAGPFSTRPEAETAEKSIRAFHRRTPTIHKVITPVPK